MATNATATCIKCLGTGNLSCFAHIELGRCFLCAGSGRIELKPAKALSAASKESTLNEIDMYLGREMNNSIAYEIAVRMLRLQDKALCLDILNSMPRASAAAVIAKGREIKAENAA